MQNIADDMQEIAVCPENIDCIFSIWYKKIIRYTNVWISGSKGMCTVPVSKNDC